MKPNTQCTAVIRKNQKRKEIKLGSEFDFVKSKYTNMAKSKSFRETQTGKAK